MDFLRAEEEIMNRCIEYFDKLTEENKEKEHIQRVDNDESEIKLISIKK